VKERLRKEAVFSHGRRDVMVVAAIAIAISVGLMYLLGIGRGASDHGEDVRSQAWQRASANAADADRAAAKLESRSKQDEADRISRIASAENARLAAPAKPRDPLAAQKQCVEVTTGILAHLATSMPTPADGDALIGRARAHDRAARKLCSTTSDAAKLSSCLGKASGADDIAACVGATLNTEQLAVYQRAAEILSSYEPGLDESDADPSGITPFDAKSDVAYRALLADMLSKLPASERAAVHRLVKDSTQQGSSK